MRSGTLKPPSVLGRALYTGWHAPRAWVARSIREGGPLEQWRTHRGRREMDAAAMTLPTLDFGVAGPLQVHVLTGHRFWSQSLFCLWTFARHVRRPLRAVVYDDGTLLEAERDHILRVIPGTRFISHAEMGETLDSHLPESRFPILRARRIEYPNLRKLTDVHSGQVGWKLVLDSDVLFFRRPVFLEQWLDGPRAPLHAVDCETSYGYSPNLLEELAGRPLADRINVGLTGLDSADIDWDRLEYWCRALIDREGTHYYQEQALVAMLLAGKACAVAPAEDYVTPPGPEEVLQCRAVMHHYVASSKSWYFRLNWRRALAMAQQ